MSSIWRINETWLRRHNADLLQEMPAKAVGVSIEPARKGGETMLLAGKYVHSKYDPHKEATKAVGGEPAQCHVHFGLGLGCFLEADAPLQNGVTLVFEPNPVMVRAALEHKDFTALMASRNATICCDMNRFRRLLSDNLKGRQPKRVDSPFHARAYPGILEEMNRQISEAVFKSDMVRRSLRIMTPLLTGNALKDLIHTARLPDVQQLKGCLKDKPCVVVSAGPSLDKNLDELVRHRDKIVVIALARSAAPLERRGVYPDFLVHNEANPYDHLIRGCSNLAETAFVLAAHAQPWFFEHDHSHTFVFGSPANLAENWIHETWPALKKAHLETGGSVANEALSLAVLMGCNPITFMGQDLSVRDDRYYAASQTNTRFRHSEDSKRRVTGYFGGQVTTLTNYLSFLIWFRDFIVTCRSKDPELRIYNATEGGVMIPGAERIKLREFIWRYCSDTVEVKPIINSASKKPRDLISIEDLTRFFRKSHTQLRELRLFCETFERDSTIEHLLLKDQRAQQNTAHDNKWLDKAQHKLTESLDRYSLLMSPLSVVNGFMQAELQDAAEVKAKRKKSQDDSSRAKTRRQIRSEWEHLCRVAAATCKASTQLEAIFEEIFTMIKGRIPKPKM